MGATDVFVKVRGHLFTTSYLHHEGSAKIMRAPIQIQSKKRVTEHPPYSAMIIEAIQSMNEKKGSSRPAILKYIVANNKVDPATIANRGRQNIRKLSEAKKIMAGRNGAGSFKVAATPGNRLKTGKNIIKKKPRAKKAPKMKKTSMSTVPKKKATVQKKTSVTPKKKVNVEKKTAAVKK